MYTPGRSSITPGRRQSKTLLIIDERARNSVFDCYLSPNWRQMAIDDSVSNDFDLRSSFIFLKFSIAAYPV